MYPPPSCVLFVRFTRAHVCCCFSVSSPSQSILKSLMKKHNGTRIDTVAFDNDPPITVLEWTLAFHTDPDRAAFAHAATAQGFECDYLLHMDLDHTFA